MPDGQFRFLVGEQRYFRRDHRGEGDRAGLELIQIDVDSLACVLDGLPLHRELLREKTYGNELIFNALESGQHRLAIVGDALPVNGAGGIDLCAAQSEGLQTKEIS